MFLRSYGEQSSMQFTEQQEKNEQIKRVRRIELMEDNDDEGIVEDNSNVDDSYDKDQEKTINK